MSFEVGQEVTIKYNGKKATVKSVSQSTIVVVDQGERTLYLKPGDIR